MSLQQMESEVQGNPSPWQLGPPPSPVVVDEGDVLSPPPSDEASIASRAPQPLARTAATIHAATSRRVREPPAGRVGTRRPGSAWSCTRRRYHGAGPRRFP